MLFAAPSLGRGQPTRPSGGRTGTRIALRIAGRCECGGYRARHLRPSGDCEKSWLPPPAAVACPPERHHLSFQSAAGSCRDVRGPDDCCQAHRSVRSARSSTCSPILLKAFVRRVLLSISCLSLFGEIAVGGPGAGTAGHRRLAVVFGPRFRPLVRGHRRWMRRHILPLLIMIGRYRE
jgi:hypothetical protein